MPLFSGNDLPRDTQATYNPEWQADGTEAGVDTNTLPWLPHPMMPGFSMKPLRASRETGTFTILIRAQKGKVVPAHVLTGSQDTFVQSGTMVYPAGPAKGELGPGAWSYLPAGTEVKGFKAVEESEYLVTCFGPQSFAKGHFSDVDVRSIAAKHGIPLVPSTLAEALEPAQPKYSGKGDKLAISSPAIARLCSHGEKPIITELSTPHVVDTNAIPWIVDPEAPDIALKVMRVSHETGHVSLIVRQNCIAPPHYHLGAADLFITSGRVGIRAGPKEGYGPGTYMFEPAGARHEATQRLTDDDLIYAANVYGPIQFDSGVGTPVLAVQSWMQYLAAARAVGTPLLANASATRAASAAPNAGARARPRISAAMGAARAAASRWFGKKKSKQPL